MYFPIADVTANPWLIILVGFTVGVCGGFFGLGGAFIATPALNILGFPMAYAIGTDMAHIMGKSLISTLTHRRLGNVDLRAGLILVAGTFPGVEAGAQLVMRLERLGLEGAAVRWVYFLVLTAMGLFMVREYRLVRGHLRRGERERAAAVLRGEGGWGERLRRLPWRPLVALPASGIGAVSLWLLLGIAFATGLLAGFLGVGGGFIRVPALIYLVGMPTAVAVGTDLLEVLFSGAYGAFTYALKGRVDVLAAVLMLAGGAVGSQIGAIATAYVEGHRIRGALAATILLTALSVLVRQLGWAGLAHGLLFGTAIGASALIVLALARGVRAARRDAAAGLRTVEGGGGG